MRRPFARFGLCALSRAFFVSERLKDGELLEDNSSSAGVLTLSRIMDSFPLSRAIGCTARPLSHTSFQDCSFFLSGFVTGHSPTASIRHDPITPSSVLLAPPISSPCPDTNGGIDHLAIGSSDWLALWLLNKSDVGGGGEGIGRALSKGGLLYNR